MCAYLCSIRYVTSGLIALRCVVEGGGRGARMNLCAWTRECAYAGRRAYANNVCVRACVRGHVYGTCTMCADVVGRSNRVCVRVCIRFRVRCLVCVHVCVCVYCVCTCAYLCMRVRTCMCVYVLCLRAYVREYVCAYIASHNRRACVQKS